MFSIPIPDASMDGCVAERVQRDQREKIKSKKKEGESVPPYIHQKTKPLFLYHPKSMNNGNVSEFAIRIAQATKSLCYVLQ